MKKKYPETFKELFENTGIEPSIDKEGNTHYNFTANKKELLDKWGDASQAKRGAEFVVEERYFTPSIEDIRVGYECEVKELPEENWEKRIFPDDMSVEQFQDMFSFIRVPYLTKEQIEKEGWSAASDSQFSKGTIWFSFQSDLQKVMFWEPAGEILFHGECKDINTFRWLCKLLSIK